MRKSILITFLLSLIAAAPNFAQSWKWARTCSCSNPNESLDAFKIVVDNAGNSYACGYAVTPTATHGPVTFTFGSHTLTDTNDVMAMGVLVSIDTGGNYRWAIGSWNGYCTISDLAIAPGGDLYLIGQCPFGHISWGAFTFTGTLFCAKIRSNGAVVWIKNLVDKADGYNIRVGHNNKLYVAGTFSDTSVTIGSTTLVNHDPSYATADVFVAEFDSSGAPVWAYGFGGTAADKCSGLALGANDEIFVAGSWLSSAMTVGSTSLTSAGGNPMYIARFRSSGACTWAKSISATTYEKLWSLAADNSGNVYLTGHYAYTFSYASDVLPHPYGYGMFLLKTDSVGTPKWARTVPGAYDGFAVTADNCGNIWTGGMYHAGGFTYDDSSFVAEFDTAGATLNIMKFSGGGEDQSDIAVDNHGNVLVGADFSVDNVIVGNDTLRRSFPSGEYISIAKYSYPYCGITLDEEQVPVAAAIIIFPNPANDMCVVQSTMEFTAGSKVTLYDMTGRQVLAFPLSGTRVEVPLHSLVTGLYTCRITSGNVIDTRKLTVVR